MEKKFRVGAEASPFKEDIPFAAAASEPLCIINAAATKKNYKKGGTCKNI